MRRNLAVLLALAVVGILLRWLVPPQIPTLDEPLEPKTFAEAEPDHRTRLPLPEAPERAAPPEAMSAATGALAEASGTGWIRCEVGGLLPDGPVNGAFAEAEVRSGILVATVTRPTGSTAIRPPVPREEMRSPVAAIKAHLALQDHPPVSIRWSGALQGQQGRCELVEMGAVRIAGRVVDGDGNPAMGAVHGCGRGALDADGRFEVDWYSGVPCELYAIQQEGTREGRGPAVTLVPNGDLTGVELEAPHTLEPMWERRLQKQREARVELEGLEGDDALERAYEQPGLSDEARLVLERWMTRRDTRIEELRRLVELEIEPPEPGDEPPW